MIWFVLFILLTVAPGEATEYFAGPSGSGSTCSSGSPCTIQTGLGKLTTPGDILTLQDGTYQGSTQMLNIAGFTDGTAGNVMTVRALNEGSVFIDGQFTRTPFNANGNDYWTITGIDFGNAGGSSSTDWVIQIANSTHLVMQRICASNTLLTQNGAPGEVGNGMVMGFYGPTSDSTFEDFCLFGTARNLLVEQSNGSNNIFRRFWTRWEGWCWSGAMIVQAPYYSDTPTPSGGSGTIYENFIMVYDPEQQSSCTPFGGRTFEPHISRTPSLAITKAGFILYGYSGFTASGVEVLAAWMRDADSSTGCVPGGCLPLYAGSRIRHWKDIFIDTRTQTSVAHAAIALSCDSGLPSGSECNSNSADRVTSIINSGNDASSFVWANVTNTAECTTLGGCPNFYTGDSPNTGSRACFEYESGALTSTKLWPWRMDDRIKTALARANAAGTGGTALSGSAGTGYAANTVTSEIVSKYGSLPSACSRSGAFTPSFPVASDFPAVAVIDNFDRADSGSLGANWNTVVGSDVFSIVSNEAVAGATFTRTIYVGSQITASHEVYATLSTIPAATDSYITILSFAGTDISENNQYRVRLNRQSSGNTLLKVVKVDGSGNESATPIAETNLGTDIADGNAFGVRVSGTTLSAYWKWSDGIWYRIDSVTDATLPTGMVYGGMAGQSSIVVNDFGAGPTSGTPEPPNPPGSSSGAGRFGTTFPGVR